MLRCWAVSFFPVWVPGSQDDDDILLKGAEPKPEIGPPACVSLSEKLCGLGGSQTPGHRDTTENRGIENGGPWFFSATALVMEQNNQFKGRPVSSHNRSSGSVIS